jgi:four helix bundle protein
MKDDKKTFNAQRSTFNIEWLGVREDAPDYAIKKTLRAHIAKKTGGKFDLEDRLLEFTVRLSKLVDALPNSRTGNHVAGQLLRCGTSPFANHGEVQAAESRKDFIHKLGVCFKELKEIRRWLRFIARVELLPTNRVRPLLIETEELIRIFSASIRTAAKNAK